jgi:hypothetical protein
MKFYNKLSDGKKSALIGGILIIILFSFLFYFADKRKKELYSDYSITSVKITEVELNASKGTITTRNIAKYSYIIKGKKYSKIVEIYQRDVKVGECYEIKISNKNPNNCQIDLNKKIKC